ncbi:hypothetical protein [Paraburkholderia sp. SIMBA_030]|uniref:hypothetical protein n=1 Tax=Paraburkholderia sp. SIMBA_030 TaxID=3085773 RepID=UPI00397C5FB6
MTNQNNTLDVANTLAQKLSDAAASHQRDAADAIGKGEFDTAIGHLNKQREATGALIATLEAVKLLNGD